MLSLNSQNRLWYKFARRSSNFIEVVFDVFDIINLFIIGQTSVTFAALVFLKFAFISLVFETTEKVLNVKYLCMYMHTDSDFVLKH